MHQNSLEGLAHGFQVAFELHNFLYCFAGVLIGNIVGVMPGMGVVAAVSILLPLTYTMSPVGAILMLSGIYYGAQYGGAICFILLNLPCHAAHAVTCLDGYPLTLKGKGGTALGITVIASFFGASFGIIVMILFAPTLVDIATEFGPAEICALMIFGLTTGATLARGSAIKGVVMTLFGLLLGTIGIDVGTGQPRLTFGMVHLQDGVELAAVALGFFGVAEFIKNVNVMRPFNATAAAVRFRDLWPSAKDLRMSALPMLRGTTIGSLCALIPGAGPTIASFVSYAFEKKISRTPEAFGHGHLPGVAAPEASTHSSVQGDFIPTMSLGIPGDAVMALLLGALMIQGITPGPQLIDTHPDIFWGLIASFWIGNILLVVLNVPMIGVWVKLLSIPYKYLYPCAIFFICMGIYGSKNDFFPLYETVFFGIVGYGLLRLGFHPAPMVLGLVLGPRLEENFRRAALLGRGHLETFIQRPISAAFIVLTIAMLAIQIYTRLRPKSGPVADRASEDEKTLHQDPVASALVLEEP